MYASEAIFIVHFIPNHKRIVRVRRIFSKELDIKAKVKITLNYDIINSFLANS